MSGAVAIAASPVAQKPSICFVAHYAYPIIAGRREISVVGGAEVQQSLIARELARRGHRVSMISLDYGQVEGEEIDGVRQLKAYAPDAGVPGLRFLHPRLTSLWSAMRRAGSDIYYFRTMGMAVAILAAFCRTHGRHSIFSGAHDMDFGVVGPSELKYARDRAMYRWGIQRVDRIVVQSDRQFDLCRQRYGRDATVIRSCYAHRGRQAVFDGPILWCATAKPHKQPHLFLELASRLPDLRFRLVGGPPGGAAAASYFEDLKQRARKLPNVEMTGFVPFADVEQQFDGASVFVNTSVGEGFPNTFLQAWSRGIPSVSFFDPQTSSDGKRVGCVVTNVDEMARVVAQLRRDRAVWLDEGRRAQALVERQYSMRGVGDAYERLIADLLGRREVV